MKKITITKIYTTDKDKAGNPLMSKQGKPYTRMSVKAKEYGEKWISGFKNQQSAEWKEGDEVDVIIEEKGEYLNFTTPKAEDKTASEISLLKTMLGGLNHRVSQLEEKVFSGARPQKDTLEYPDDDINVEDIPF